ncbi:MAG: hypothetical protein ABI342_07450 [Nitrososphaera sp.]|jgi:hypothetical protein
MFASSAIALILVEAVVDENSMIDKYIRKGDNCDDAEEKAKRNIRLFRLASSLIPFSIGMFFSSWGFLSARP